MVTNFITLTIWVLKTLKTNKLREHAFERKVKNAYEIEKITDMTRIHDDKVNKISEWNWLLDKIDPTKRTKKLIAITILFNMIVWIIE